MSSPELNDSRPMEHYGEMFVSQDLRLCLEGAMRASLDEAVARGWYDRETADTEFETWHRQFD